MRKDRGAALLFVVLLVSLLTVMVAEFQREAWVRMRAAENLRDELQAHALVRSGCDVISNLLTIYGAQSLADIRQALPLMKQGTLLEQLFFGAEPIDLPVPSGLDEGYVLLKVKMEDLYGRFPLGALKGEAAAAAPRQKAFENFLDAVRAFRGSMDNKVLESMDAEALAREVTQYLNASNDASIDDLDQLTGLEGFTPEIVKAISQYVDTRKEWKFNINTRCIPLIMAMKNMSVEEARTVAEEIRTDPIDDDSQIPNSPAFNGMDANTYPASSLTVKSKGFQVFFEINVRSATRRAKATFRRPELQTDPNDNRFRLEEWSEGWLEEWIEKEEPVPAERGATST